VIDHVGLAVSDLDYGAFVLDPDANIEAVCHRPA
jgi:hypothetical protein